MLGYNHDEEENMATIRKDISSLVNEIESVTQSPKLSPESKLKELVVPIAKLQYEVLRLQEANSRDEYLPKEIKWARSHRHPPIKAKGKEK